MLCRSLLVLLSFFLLAIALSDLLRLGHFITSFVSSSFSFLNHINAICFQARKSYFPLSKIYLISKMNVEIFRTYGNTALTIWYLQSFRSTKYKSCISSTTFSALGLHMLNRKYFKELTIESNIL